MTWFFSTALKKDIYFPRFHLTLPGMMTEPSMSSYKRGSGYHIYPHDCSDWMGHFFYPGTHVWQHFYSKDLLEWRLMPLPFEYGNTGNMIETDKGAICYPAQGNLKSKPFVYKRWISTDEKQEFWGFDKDIEIPSPPSGVFPYNHYLFEHDGNKYLLGSYAALVGCGRSRNSRPNGTLSLKGQ
jgi:hypothetical protein